ncbi:patatin-like phospholipase family protein [Dermatophilaceae bacterium Soc4.6]
MADADLVLEGGGVKGAALVGALSVLDGAPDPYRFHRIAGTSAGAIVASLLAAGYSVGELKEVMDELNFSQFEDVSPVLRHFKLLGEGFGLLFEEGLFRGDFLHSWVAEKLAAKGLHTWGQLKDLDAHSSLPPERQYKLVVVVSDVSRGRELRLPWDYQKLCGVSPDNQPVADAVRASASIPFFFRPFRMRVDPAVAGGHPEILCTDGGMLSNFPIDLFDRTDGGQPRWPTLGVKLSAKAQAIDPGWHPNPGPLELATSLISTMTNAHDQLYVSDPSFSSRTVFVDTTGYKATDFHLTADDKATLFSNGVSAGTAFVDTWDWEGWKAQYRPTAAS